MTKQLHQIASWFLGLLLMVVCLNLKVQGAALFGTYTIDASQPASASNFQNLSSAITYLTSANTRSDAGPSNSAPFGVSGPVTFDYAVNTGPYTEQVVIPAIPGASTVNKITINGNGCTMQFNTATSGSYHIIRLDGADHITINSLKLKSTNTVTGWGLHFINGADSNTVYGTTIDLTAHTSYSTNSCAIAFSGSTTSVTTSGVCGYHNTIINDTILNSLNGGPYYNITNFQSNASVYSGNKFIGNLIENSSYFSYYGQYTNGTLIKDNEFRSTTRTSILSTRYDIYIVNGARYDSIVGNRFHNPMGTLQTTTLAYYGIYMSSTNTPAGNNNYIANNRFYDIKSSGSIYGIYLTYAQNVNVYHNTISLDHTTSTVNGTYVTQGLYTDNSATGNGVNFKNNIISATRGGTSVKTGIVVGTSGIYGIDNNNYYIPGGNVGMNSGVAYASIGSWKSGTGTFDQNSYGLNPFYTNVATANFTPQEGMINDAGANLLSAVPFDAANNARTATPDLGAFEFTPTNMNDAGVVDLLTPVSPFNQGKYLVSGKIKNAGTLTLTNVDINWSVNGVAQTPIAWAGSLSTGQTSATFNLDSVLFLTGVNNTIKAWTSNPNFSTDAAMANDTFTAANIYSTLVGGTYTINAGAAPSATNFTSFTQLADALNGGITGAVTINVVSASGPYNEQVIFNKVPGASPVNNIVINGNNNTLQYAASAANYAQLRLNGAKHFTIQDLTVKNLSTQYGWGLHFISNADSNKIINCYFDATATTVASTTNSGIVFSNSLTSPTTSGENGKGNLIMGNTIIGPVTGANYYGIVHIPSASAATASNNKFINNTIQNFYNYGIYNLYSNGTLYKGNIIKNDARTQFTTIYGIYMANGSRGDTIINNIIENPFGGNILSTSTFYGIQIASPGTQTTNHNIIANNIIRNVRSNGIQYGISATTASNNKFLHNTIIIDNPTSTSASTSYGVYLNGTPTSGTLEFKNNIVYINRGVTNTYYNLYIVTATANYTTGSINNNIYYKTGTGAINNMGYYGGTICNTFANWQAVNGGFFDAAGKFVNPFFTNISSNSIPRDGSLNAAGANVLTRVPTDFAGVARTTTPDIGAFEFTPAAIDAGVASIIPPASPFAAGTGTVNVTIKNGGTSTLTSATINWMVNGVTQTPYNWSGSLAAGVTSTNINIGNATFVASLNNVIVAWTSAPNGSSDGLMENDSATYSGIYTSLTPGAYTINKNVAASASNFTSFTAAANSLNLGGIAGAVTIDVVSGSGPYNEQFFLNNIPGANATNKVTINGNNQEINFNNTLPASLPVIGFNNTKHLIIDNLKVRTLNATYGVGIMFTNNSDSNIVQNCNLDLSSITGTSSTNSAGIAFCSGFGTLTGTAANTGSANLILNNTIDGGAASGCYYGIILNGSNTTNPVYSHNKLIGNTIKDVYIYGIYTAYTTRTAIKKNIISRPTKTAPTTFYGIYVVNGSQADTLEGNLIYKPYGMLPANTSTTYGIYVNSTSPLVATPSIIKNNVITDFKGAGTLYGIASGTNAYIKIYHNTINIVDANTSANVVYGIYSTGAATNVAIKNNVVNVDKPGTSNRFAIYFNTTSVSGYQTNNNALRATGATGYIGYYSAVNYSTLANWKTANSGVFDQNSVSADPAYRNQLDPNFLQPGNDTLDNIGANLLADVPVDFTGTAHSTTPDPGAYNFITYPNDAGIYSFVALGSNSSAIIPITANPFTLETSVKNYGTAVLNSASINWSLGGVLQTPTSYSGALAKNDTGVVNLGFVTIGSGINQIKAWTSSPNSATDASNLNDTFSLRVCLPISGTLTVNALWPDTGSNFSSFPSILAALQNCGISGPVTINIGAGTYSQQLTMPNNIPGQSSVNTVTFDGIDSAICKIEHNGGASRATLLLDGAKNYVFKNITFTGTNAANATAVQLINSADSNTFVKCAFNVPSVASTAVNSFVVSGSVTSPTTAGNGANYLLVDSCSAKGGYYGGFVFYGLAANKSVYNSIKNSVISNSYNSGMYVYYQRNVTIEGNTITAVGIPVAPGTVYGIDVRYCDSASKIVRNRINNLNSTTSFYGLYSYQNLGSVTNRVVVANNIIDVGVQLLNNTYGLYDYDNGNTDFVYNSVRINSGDPNYISSAYYNNVLNPATYNNNRVLNNIFVAPNGALTANVINLNNIIAAQYIMNNNVYYSSNLYPFRVVNFITATLANFSTNTVTMLGNLVGNNTNSLFMLPTFDSKLRSINPQLDGAGTPVTTVTNDVENNLRDLSTPDIGGYEFSKPMNDAGIVAILSPAKPLVAGLNDIKAVIRNHGLSALTSCDVTYNIGNVTHSLLYTGNIPSLGYDTVIFNSTSGIGSTSQQYNFTGITETIKVWTSNPNMAFDSIPTNDTAFNTMCTGLGGTYTIDPAGSGPNNFLSIQAALDKMNCGGVYAHVYFDIAAGTYTGQYSIPTIVGASDTSRVIFRSASNNPASVTVTFSPLTAGTNYVFYLDGAKYIEFNALTLQNTNATYGRVIAMGTFSATNTTSSNIQVTNCVITGPTVTTTADANALIYTVNGNTTPDLAFSNNSFNGGSMAMYLGGPNIVNQFSPNLIIDSNTFNNHYYYSIYMTNRSANKIRRNTINIGSSAYYGIYSVGTASQCVIADNMINNNGGSGYAIGINNHAYYNAAGELTIKNNVVNFNGGSGVQYGISVSNSSYIEVYHNTIRTGSSSTAYALYFSGHAAFLSGITNYPQAQFYSVRNNVLNAQNGYALYSANIYSDSALAIAYATNRNVYYSGSGTALFGRATNFDVANFLSGYRNLYYNGSDAQSRIGNVVFTATNNLKPNESNSSVWLVNGNADLVANISSDITGAARSQTPSTGSADIGAFEVAPMVEPAPATLSGTIGYGNTQAVLAYGDTVAWLTWGFGGVLPSTLTAKYYQGSYVSHPAQFPIGSPGHSLDVHWKFEQTGGAGYLYDVKLKYDPVNLGTIPSESDLRFAGKDSGATAYWMPLGFTSTVLDTDANTFAVNYQYSMYLMTGTTDLSPLPVKLTSFIAKREQNNALLNWITALERNASRFEIERSWDGSLFNKIGEVSAKGNSNTAMRYTFTDIGVASLARSNQAFYRLKMINRDGSFEYSEVRSISFERAGRTVAVFPNPFNRSISLRLTNAIETVEYLEITDVYGKVIKTITRPVINDANTITINEIEDLTTGIYFISAKVNGEQFIQKIIKQ